MKFAGLDIAEMGRMPLKQTDEIFHPFATSKAPSLAKFEREHPEKAEVTHRIADDLCAWLSIMLDLGVGYLTLEPRTPTLSPGELQRLFMPSFSLTRR